MRGFEICEKGKNILTPYPSVSCARPEVRILAFRYFSCHSIRQLSRRIRGDRGRIPVERCKVTRHDNKRVFFVCRLNVFTAV